MSIQFFQPLQLIIYYKNAKKHRNVPLNNPNDPTPSITLLFAYNLLNQTFLKKKTVEIISLDFAQLVIISLHSLWEGIRLQGFKFFRWLITFLFLIIQKEYQLTLNQREVVYLLTVMAETLSSDLQISTFHLVYKNKISPFFVRKVLFILIFFPRQKLSLRTLQVTTTFASLTMYHPSKIKGINTCTIIFAWLIFCAKLQMKVNIRGLEGTGESNYRCPLMSIGPVIKLACKNCIFSDYNLNMISKKKEIQENLLYYNSKQVLQLSTAQEKDSLSNARPLQQTFSQIVEENCEEELLTPQNSFCHFLEESGSESNTSFEKKLTFEHLTCLEANIQEITKHVLKVPKSLDLTKLCDYEFQDNQQTFGTFIQGPRSPIPPSQRPQFLKLLKQNSCLRKVIMWIYGHVQCLLSDELILTAHRIALAYHPIKAFVTGAAELQKLADLEFNIWNVYNDPTLKLLQYSQLLQFQQGGLYYDAHLHQFFRFYLVTILLVLQEFFENPDFGNTLGSKLCHSHKNDPAMHKKASKSKTIRKREKSNH